MGSLLWTLTALFAIRVAGQAIQRWAPVSFLPPEGAFQGSGLPYSVLLATQIVILALMARVSWRAGRREVKPSRRWAVFLKWAGTVYMAVAVGRIAIGLAVPAAPAWFSTWIPAVFHVVLAAFVLASAAYHSRRPS